MSQPTKHYPVWQLMDGTVVIQAPKDPSPYLQAGKMAWFEQHGLTREPSLKKRLRHYLFRFLETL